MKNSICMLMIGMGMGMGAMFMIEQYKTGNLQETVKKAGKKVDKMLDNMN